MSLSQNLISTNACKSQSYINLVLQRKRAQLYNIPPTRYDNLVTNPYIKINPSTGNFLTNFDVSMRRKAEILKYSNNTSSTKSNNLTKAQIWSQIVNGKSNRQYSQAYINSNPAPCPDTIVYTPSTASGVPGPPVLLYEDDNVPLYNLINDATQGGNYGLLDTPLSNIFWSTYPISNAISLQDTTFVVSKNSIFNTLVFQSNVVTTSSIFSMTIPLVIYVEADASTNLVGHYQDPNAIQISVSEVTLAVFYSESQIPLNADISYSLSNIVYNSTANAMNIAADVSVNLQIKNSAYNKFYAYGYAGEVKINNIFIPTQPGYIYDMELGVKFDVGTSSDFSTYFGSIPSVYFAYLNPTYEITEMPPLNCTITNPYKQILPFSISGTTSI